MSGAKNWRRLPSAVRIRPASAASTYFATLLPPHLLLHGLRPKRNTIRDGLVNSRTATCNQIRGLAWDARSLLTRRVLFARRLLPEAAVGFAAWMAAQRGGLAQPLDAMDLAGASIVGGWILRAGLYLATLVHGAGHALAAAVLTPGTGPETLRERMAD